MRATSATRASRMLNAREETCRLVSCRRGIGSRIGSAVTVRSIWVRPRDKSVPSTNVPSQTNGLHHRVTDWRKTVRRQKAQPDERDDAAAAISPPPMLTRSLAYGLVAIAASSKQGCNANCSNEHHRVTFLIVVETCKHWASNRRQPLKGHAVERVRALTGRTEELSAACSTAISRTVAFTTRQMTLERDSLNQRRAACASSE
jgi:hypothetical protein